MAIARPPITFIQSSDPGDYFRMLFETSRTIRAYAERHGHAYEAFIGLRRGHLPWHASYNRIGMLKDMVAQGRSGWVAYFDADAYVADQSFDLGAYLGRRSDKAAVFFHASPESVWFDINNGAFFLNLDSHVGRDIVRQWAEALDKVSDEKFAESTEWGKTFDDDQYMLQKVLQASPFSSRVDHAGAELRAFVHQYLRAHESDLGKRIAVLTARARAALGERLGDEGEAQALRTVGHADAERFVQVMYRALLGRAPDASGLASYSAGLIGGLSDELAPFVAAMEAILDSEEFKNRWASRSSAVSRSA